MPMLTSETPERLRQATSPGVRQRINPRERATQESSRSRICVRHTRGRGLRKNCRSVRVQAAAEEGLHLPLADLPLDSHPRHATANPPAGRIPSSGVVVG